MKTGKIEGIGVKLIQELIKNVPAGEPFAIDCTEGGRCIWAAPFPGARTVAPDELARRENYAAIFERGNFADDPGRYCFKPLAQKIFGNDCRAESATVERDAEKNALIIKCDGRFTLGELSQWERRGELPNFKEGACFHVEKSALLEALKKAKSGMKSGESVIFALCNAGAAFGRGQDIWAAHLTQATEEKRAALCKLSKDESNRIERLLKCDGDLTVFYDCVKISFIIKSGNIERVFCVDGNIRIGDAGKMAGAFKDVYLTEKAPTKKAPSKKAKKAPKSDASTATATNTTPAAKAPEKQAEETEQAKEETTEKPEQEKEEKPSVPPCRAFVFSSSDVSSRPGEVLATVKKALASDYENEQPSREEKQAAEQPSKERNALEDDPVFQAMKRAMESAKISEPAPVESALQPSDQAPAPAPAEPMEAPQPQPSEPSRADEPSAAEPKKSGWEIGTYTTKKGKVKTAIRFFQPPTPAQIEALKTAFYWEYNGTWNGSPRKLPEIFKH